jgi:hypothetical protein
MKLMSLNGKIRLYKAYLEDLINTVKEENGIDNINGIDREGFIQNIINAFSVRSSIEKYFGKKDLKEDELLLELADLLKEDEEIYNFFYNFFKFYLELKT